MLDLGFLLLLNLFGLLGFFVFFMFLVMVLIFGLGIQFNLYGLVHDH